MKHVIRHLKTHVLIGPQILNSIHVAVKRYFISLIETVGMGPLKNDKPH